MLRCAELRLSDTALDELSVGMVYDMLIEKANDNEEYPYQATEEDYAKFF